MEESRGETQEEQDPADHGQTQSNTDPFEPTFPYSIIERENPLTVSGIELIPFTPT